MKSTGKLIIFIFTLLALAASSFNASAAAPEPLPPAAQEAINKGIIAAKVPDYLLAIRFFEEARKLAPQSPVVYLNLGLAESRIPGRELRAIAWFGAYLAANPEAPNAAAVKEQIGVLEVRNQSNTLRFLRIVQDAANQLSDKDGRQSMGLLYVATLWLDSGDIASAQKTADLIRFADPKAHALLYIAEAKVKAGDLAGAKITFAAALKSTELIDTEREFGLGSAPYHKSQVLSLIASAQAYAGDISGAQKTVDLITNEFLSHKSYPQAAIAGAQAKAGDIAGAQQTFASAVKSADLIIGWANGKHYAQLHIAAVQMDAGDMAGARQTLVSAAKNADLFEGDAKSEAQSIIAKAQIKAGDMTSAIQTLASAQKTVDLIRDSADKSRVQSYIAEAQLEAGDLAGAKLTLASAQKTTDLIQGESYGKSWAQSALAEAQARSGDIAGAQKNADLIQDANSKSRALSTIAEAQTKADIAKKPNSTRQSTSAIPIQPIIKVSDWLKKLDDDNKSNDCPLNTGPFLDLAGYLKIVPSSGDPQTIFNSLNETAETIVKAQKIITGMLKQEAKK